MPQPKVREMPPVMHIAGAGFIIGACTMLLFLMYATHMLEPPRMPNDWLTQTSAPR